jgi:hypothetical protein
MTSFIFRIQGLHGNYLAFPCPVKHNTAMKPKRPRDVNQLAKFIGDSLTGQTPAPVPEDTRNPAAVALGRLGGLKGGKARAAKLTKKRRAEIAKRAAQARWGKQ